MLTITYFLFLLLIFWHNIIPVVVLSKGAGRKWLLVVSVTLTLSFFFPLLFIFKLSLIWELELFPLNKYFLLCSIHLSTQNIFLLIHYSTKHSTKHFTKIKENDTLFCDVTITKLSRHVLNAISKIYFL